MLDLHGLPGSGTVLVDAPLAVAVADVAEVRAYFREEIFVAQRRDGSTVTLSRYDYYRLIAALGAAVTLKARREVTGWYDAVWQVLGVRQGGSAEGGEAS